MDSMLLQNLSALRDAQIIDDIDLQFCRFLQEIRPEAADEVLLAACLTSHAFRNGHVCIFLDEYAGGNAFPEADTNIQVPSSEAWIQSLDRSLLVGKAGSYRPLILDDSGRLYLHRLWHIEQSLAENILSRLKQKPYDPDLNILKNGLQRLFEDFEADSDEIDWQKIAAITAIRNNFTVISGGPGTGKTTTVVKIIALLLEQWLNEKEQPLIALAAPTGKAAARLEASVTESQDHLNIEKNIRDAIPTEAKTLHQLLGASRHRSGFRFNRENPLPYDLVIVDEASMVDQALMSKLMEALLRDSRLILIGDKDQLASVEAGSVLGSICAYNSNSFTANFGTTLRKLSIELPEDYIDPEVDKLRDHIVLLQKSYRFDKNSGIPGLCSLINLGKASDALHLLEKETFNEVTFQSVDSREALHKIIDEIVTQYFEPMVSTRDPEEIFRRFGTFRLLSPHRRGPLGIEDLNRRVKSHLVNRGLISRYDHWYHGRPVIINRNDYSLGLNNGDTGICLHSEDGELLVWFRDGDGFLPIPPSRLPDHDTAFSLTVHKSQGSEYDHVLLMLPNRPSRILTRELLYTAVSRATTSVTIAGSKEVLSLGIEARLQRSSGLKDLLWDTTPNS